MKMKRFFYDSTVNFKNVSISKIIAAILIGICSAITIYSFFYVLRESFRYLSIGFGNNPHIISEANRNFYNLFFAGLSVIFGNSIAINFVFSKPQKITHRFNPKRKRLLNDQIFLSFNFSYLFVKIGLIFGVFSMCCMDFEFLPYFQYISFLLLVVLYLEAQKSLGMLLSNSQRWKFLLMHLVLLLVISFSISKLNTIDYKKMDKIMLSNNPNIDFPFSEFYNDDSYGNRFSYELKLQTDANNNTIIFAQDKKWQLDNVSAIVMQENAYRRHDETPLIQVNILADKDLSIQVIKEIELQLFTNNQTKISYTVNTNDTLLSRFERRGIKKIILPDILGFDDTATTNVSPHPLLANFKKYTNKIEIRIGEKILFNNVEINDYDTLVSSFIESYSNETIFEYRFQENAVYQDYIHVLSAHFSAVYQLRKGQQTIFLKNKYERNVLYEEEQKELRELFPLIILEKFI